MRSRTITINKLSRYKYFMQTMLLECIRSLRSTMIASPLVEADVVFSAWSVLQQ
jgi:hypothetical protein